MVYYSTTFLKEVNTCRRTMSAIMDGTFSGARLRRIREQQGLSRQALAVRAGLSRAYVYSLEQGNENDEGARRPSYDVVARLARSLGVEAAALIETRPAFAEFAAMTAMAAPSAGLEAEMPAEGTIPPSLAEAADRFDIPPNDVAELARLSYRGRQPRAALDWAHLWLALRKAVHWD
jgi:transcriptional regulator with XRE-family HTH domain